MVKAAVDVSPVVEAYVARLKDKFDVERVILCDIHTNGVDGEPVDIEFIVVSAVFEPLDELKKSEVLGMAGYEVSTLIQAFPYTPEEFDGYFRGDFYDGLLAQFLSGSREVYVKPGSTPLKKLRKVAGGKQR